MNIVDHDNEIGLQVCLKICSTAVSNIYLASNLLIDHFLACFTHLSSDLYEEQVNIEESFLQICDGCNMLSSLPFCIYMQLPAFVYPPDV